MTSQVESQRPFSAETAMRDMLAQDRTILANERTFLAYVRTALTLLVAGVSFIRFFDSVLIAALGWLFVPCGVAVQVIGTWRYLRMHRLVMSHGGGSAGRR